MPSKKMSKVTLHDVARVAGVSRGAAGKVLNNCTGSIRVGKEARERIKKAAKELGYRGNMAAAMLAGKKSPLVGVMIDSHSSFRRMKLLAELERAATRRNLRLMISWTHDNIEQMRTNRREMESFGVRGLICLAHDYYEFKDDVIELFAADCSNVVFLEEPFFPGSSFVASNNEDAMTGLCGYLKSIGRRRIALLHGSLQWHSEREQERVFKSALIRNGMVFDPEMVQYLEIEGDPMQKSRNTLRDFILTQRPDAVIADDAPSLLCLQKAVYNTGIKIPEDIVLCGCNNDPLFGLFSPPVISLAPRYTEIAEALLDAVEADMPGCQAVIKARFSAPQAVEKIDVPEVLTV